MVSSIQGQIQGGGDILLAAPPGIWREKGENIEIHNICNIILLQFLLRLYFPFKVNEKCGIIPFYLIL